jgi:NAD(P)-dependent dehydrogenase (short-subunit alcohol dehydrogenase family)
MPSRSVVIVTGASRGLGASISQWLARAQATVVLIARTERGLQAVAGHCSDLGAEAFYLPMDVTDSEACFRAVESLLKRYGKIDAIINNAALAGPVNPIGISSADKWARTLAVNLLGAFYLTRGAVEVLRRQKGRVINVSSGAATMALASLSAYCCSKAALEQLTSVLAIEEPLITAVSVLPGILDTDMQAQLRRDSRTGMSEAQAQYYQDLKDTGQLAPAWKAARSIAWLALKAPRHMSGKRINFNDPAVLHASNDMFGDPSEALGPKPF